MAGLGQNSRQGCDSTATRAGTEQPPGLGQQSHQGWDRTATRAGTAKPPGLGQQSHQGCSDSLVCIPKKFLKKHQHSSPTPGKIKPLSGESGGSTRSWKSNSCSESLLSRSLQCPASQGHLITDSLIFQPQKGLLYLPGLTSCTEPVRNQPLLLPANGGSSEWEKKCVSGKKCVRCVCAQQDRDPQPNPDPTKPRALGIKSCLFPGMLNPLN